MSARQNRLYGLNKQKLIPVKFRSKCCTPATMGVKMGLFRAKNKEKALNSEEFRTFRGGDKRDRTADLLNAIQALSQLSYTPIFGLLCQTAFVL